MEWKIGEIKQVNGEWYQCVKSPKFGECDGCAFDKTDCYKKTKKPLGFCSYDMREDNEEVIFKKLEKVGEPYIAYGNVRQKYKLHIPLTITNEIIERCISCDDVYVVIEIKQNKENMEEKNKAEGLPLLRLVGKYMNSLINYATFEKAVKELYTNKEESKPKLKEFDLEAAKAGKPVCTRDGRKARIICFDRKLTYKNVSYPILALVKRDGEDDVCCYNEKGKVLVEDDLTYKDDLMMLPEKKEGWAVIFKDDLLRTEQGAKDLAEKSISEVVRIEKIEYEE